MERLRDNYIETYWQSDGQLPHLVNIQFQRKTTVNQIYIYTDYKLDESYTPSRISIRSGTHFNDLQEIEIIDLSEPTGIVYMILLEVIFRGKEHGFPQHGDDGNMDIHK